MIPIENRKSKIPNTTPTIAAEICVIGGGPAGASIARRLALLGHDVCLIEAQAFPRPHIGESLPSSILQPLEILGVRNRIEQAGFLRPERALIRWSAVHPGEKVPVSEPGFQVDRGQFDQILLKAAQEAGTLIFQPARAQRPQHHGLNAWVIPVQSSVGNFNINASFLVDATGKGGKQQRNSAFTIALYGYWQNTNIQGSETRVEAGANQWYWGAPLPDGSFNAAVFIDPHHYPHRSKTARQQLYYSLLAQSQFLAGCLDGALASGLLTCDASSYFSDSPITSDSIRVGEAAFAIDPLSSQGVQAAIMSAIQGSIVAHTLLTFPENALAAIDFYQDRLKETVARHEKIAAQFYAEQDLYPATAFWEDRATNFSSTNIPNFEPTNTSAPSGDCRVCLSAAAKIVPTPTIKGNSIQTIPALEHPGLERPVAYLGNIAIAPLIAELRELPTIWELIAKWSNQLPENLCWSVLQWLWNHHLIVPISPSDSNISPHVKV